MTKDEFFEKYKIHFENPIEEMTFFLALDNLYVQFPKERVLEIVNDYYDNADDLFEETRQLLEQTSRVLTEMFGADLEPLEEEKEETVDKKKMN